VSTGEQDVGPGVQRRGEREILVGILNRLEQVERDNRRLRRNGVTMLVVLAMVLGLGAALVYYSGGMGLPGAPETVAATQFMLRDGKGVTRGAWGMTEDGSVRLVLSDASGRQRVRLSLLEDGSAGLSFADTADRKLAVLGLLADHTTNLALTDPAGIPARFWAYRPTDPPIWCSPISRGPPGPAWGGQPRPGYVHPGRASGRGSPKSSSTPFRPTRRTAALGGSPPPAQRRR
jgi:hypothetical protein